IQRIFRVENTTAQGLGEPLPSGQIAFFQRALGLRQLVGEDVTMDKAVGEEIDFVLGEADNVTLEVHSGASGENWEQTVVTVRNANPEAVTVETELVPQTDTAIRDISARTFERDGRQVWRVEVPANGEVELRFSEYETD
ncbi:MAG: hypothetical protein WA936_04795, partial [Erythrobacter sp.]